MSATAHALAARADGIVRSRLAAIPWEDTRAALLGLLTIGAVGSDHGGYFPTSWGWAALVLAWLALVALAARAEVRLAWPELATLAAVAGLAAWTLLSFLWTGSQTESGLVFERTLVYVAGVAAALVVVRSSSYRALVGGVWGGTLVVCGFGLLTRLFSARFHGSAGIAGDRLERPLGYWNSFGLLAAVGVVLALGLAVHGRAPLTRALASASVVPLSAALYFTFSRGAWLALGLALVFLIAVDPRRLQFVAGGLFVAPWPVLGVLLASRQASLTAAGALGPHAITEGRHLAGRLAVLMLVAAAAALPLSRAVRVVARPAYERSFALAAALASVVVLVGIFAAYGSPVSIAKRGWHAFNAPPADVQGSLNARLSSFSGSWRVDLWRVALDDWRAHPLLGSGAGTYQRQWLLRRTTGSPVINAHSLYLETLAELGPVGLVLVLALFAIPLLAAHRARERPLVPVTAAALVAFLVHAGVDWDWQLTAVGLAAVFLAVALLAASRSELPVVRLGTRGRLAFGTGVLAVAVLAGIGLVGNRATAASANAVLVRNYARAESQARRAIDWEPWSSAGWQALGDAQYQQGKVAAARASYGRALAKDRANWELWLDVALTSRGAAQTRAAREAQRLNPLAPEIQSIAPALGL